MIKAIAFTLLLLSQLPDYHPELLPNPLEDIEIKAEINRSAEGYFIFSYEIYNPPKNNGRIWSIDIDVKKGEGESELNRGLELGVRCHKYGTEDVIASETVVPVGMDSPPNWSCGVGTSKIAGWGAYDYPYHLLPGQSLSGFVITSYGLPGIRDIIVEPLIVDTVYPEVDEEEVKMEELIRLMKADREKVSFKGKTLGPTAPPADFKPLEFLNYIISMKHEASTLGWITNKGIEMSLDAKLEAAKKKLEEYP
ncbi:MAG: hypothetical protein HY805_01505 [Nitrospirae bacterium]|nr:hypothetical protein [Nitrospirota bacterium]